MIVNHNAGQLNPVYELSHPSEMKSKENGGDGGGGGGGGGGDIAVEKEEIQRLVDREIELVEIVEKQKIQIKKLEEELETYRGARKLDD